VEFVSTSIDCTVILARLSLWARSSSVGNEEAAIGQTVLCHMKLQGTSLIDEEQGRPGFAPPC
jgi:hypothetical protein